MLETSITLTQQAEQALQESLSRIRKVLNTSRIGVWEYELATGKLRWSEGVEALLDLPPNSQMDNFVDYLHPDDREAIEQAIHFCSTSQTHHCFEHRIICPNGTVRWLEAKAEVWRDETSNASSIIITAVDITPRKAAEAALRESETRLKEQTQQLQQTLHKLQQTQSQLVHSEKMSSLGQLIAGIAHEINNPANFIHANLYYASQYTQNLLELLHLYQIQFSNVTPNIARKIEAIDLEFIKEDLPNLLSSMQVGTQRICEIVLSLRTFSRVDESEIKAVDLHAGLDSTLRLLENRLNNRSGYSPIQVIKEYGNLPLVECYAGQLNQVFMNILTNAIDALEELQVEKLRIESSSLHSSIPMIRIRTSVVNSDWVTIQIADNGPGIPEAFLQQVFNPFFTTKPVGKGTGLGMAISYEIVTKKHGGLLRCSSTVGQGTEFSIAIPRKIFDPDRDSV